MRRTIPDGIREEHILAALEDLRSGVAHPFGDSTTYDVLFAGKRYPPKAVVGLAAGKLTGSRLGPSDFRGGQDTICFRIIRKLGFEIVPKSDLQSAPVIATNLIASSPAALNKRHHLVMRPAPKLNSGRQLSARAFVSLAVDYEEEDRKHRELGRTGEELVFDHEVNSLRSIGRADLAAQVEPVSWTKGDGLGYDIKSYDPSTGQEVHIEVKTTCGPAETPFYMSAFEVDYITLCAARYKIARFYNYREDKGDVYYFCIDGADVLEQLELTPVSYRARVR